MNELTPVFYMIVGVILRIGIPIGITLLLGWFLNRLDARWRAEAKQIQETMTNRTVPNSIQPCWEVMNCAPRMRENCPVNGNLGILCWELFGSNGNLQPKCQNCPYRQSVLSTKDHSYA